MEQSSAPTFRQFDGLRALAIAGVVAIHTLQSVSLSSTRFLRGGSSGVDLFFALSGFLITYLLLEEIDRSGKIRFRRFYARRALRLVPALMAMLCAQAVWATLAGIPIAEELRSLVMAATYVSNFGYAYSTIAPGLAHTWSLAVEAQFYLLWPILLAVLISRRWQQRQIALLVGVLVAACGADAAVSWELSRHWNTVYVRPDVRACTLMAGAAAALAVRNRLVNRATARSMSIAGWLIFGICLFTLAGNTPTFFLGGMVVLALASIAMVLGAALEVGPFGRLLTSRAVQWFGTRSYGLYLWHLPVVFAFARFTRVPTGPRIVLALAVALACTALSYRYVERPFLRKKERYSGLSEEESPETSEEVAIFSTPVMAWVPSVAQLPVSAE